MTPDRPNVLFVCSRNQWRSPTAERIFRNDARIAVRSAGVSDKAVRRVTNPDIDWADVIFVMESEHRSRLKQAFGNQLHGTTIRCLDIPDDYQFMDPELIDLLEDAIIRHLEDLFGDHWAQHPND